MPLISFTNAYDMMSVFEQTQDQFRGSKIALDISSKKELENDSD